MDLPQTSLVGVKIAPVESRTSGYGRATIRLGRSWSILRCAVPRTTYVPDDAMLASRSSEAE